jgi:ComF family protein
MGLVSGFIDLVSPPVCFSCGGRSYVPLCRSCDGMIEIIGEPFCDVCGKPGMHENNRCPDCRSKRPKFDYARAYAVYEFPIRESVIAMKRRSGRRLAEYVAPRMAKAFVSELDGADFITYVPITPGRKANRGHNQAQELAAAVAGLAGKPVIGTLRLTKAVKDQGRSRLKPEEREENIEAAFAIRNKSERLAGIIRGSSLILIDDVLTTGSTVSACAHVLKEAGAERVLVLTLARAAGKGFPQACR